MYFIFKQTKKKTTIILLTLVTLLITLNIATATTYIGSSQSNKFHYIDCRWAKKSILVMPYILVVVKKLLAMDMYLAKYVNHKILNLIN